MELCENKIVDPLEAHDNGSVERNFSKFLGEKFKELYFVYLLTHPTETAYLRFQDRELSNDVWLVEVRRRKLLVHSFLGLTQPRLIRLLSCWNYRKP